MAFWDDSQKYLYLPRLKSREVLASVVRAGAASKDFFGTAYGHTGGKFEGFQFGDGDISFNDTLLLIEPEAATQYAIEQKKQEVFGVDQFSPLATTRIPFAGHSLGAASFGVRADWAVSRR